MSVRPAIDLDEAARFLAALDPSADAQFAVQPYTDDQTRPRPKRDPFAREQRFGSLAAIAQDLVRLNRGGAAIAPIVNELDGRGFKAANVKRVRAVFVEVDTDGLAGSSAPSTGR